MNEQQRLEILEKAKYFFKEKVAKNHKKNTEKLADLKQFDINPFLQKYLANFAFGNDTPENLAKVLLYPRILGTSINTTFGTQLQYFCNEVLESFASTTSGIDIEFNDAIDGRHKYCQIKSGPNTINHDDVTTIKNHFIAIKNLARTNHMKDFNPMTDCIVGIFYGSPTDMSVSYKNIDKEYPVFIGKEFWHRLTGDENFYFELIDVFAEVAVEIDSHEMIDEILQKLTLQIKKQIEDAN